MVTRTQIKNTFESVSKLALKHRLAQKKLDDQQREFFGFHYDEKEHLKDNDDIIDTLDYGTSGLTFETFEKLMKTNNFREIIDVVEDKG